METSQSLLLNRLRERILQSLAIFDFDGTITNSESFTPFLRFAIPPTRLAFAAAILSPLILAYKWNLLAASPLRRSLIMLGFFGEKETDVLNIGKKYSRDHLGKLVRPKAIERIEWHKNRGDIVVVVSASLSLYLSDWCNKLEVDLICTELESLNGVFTGQYRGGDCTGATKAARIRKKYDLNVFHDIYAYGDTNEDFEILKLANKKFFRWRTISNLEDGEEPLVRKDLHPSHRARLQTMGQEDLALHELVRNQK